MIKLNTLKNIFYVFFTTLISRNKKILVLVNTITNAFLVRRKQKDQDLLPGYFNTKIQDGDALLVTINKKFIKKYIKRKIIIFFYSLI